MFVVVIVVKFLSFMIFKKYFMVG